MVTLSRWRQIMPLRKRAVFEVVEDMHEGMRISTAVDGRGPVYHHISYNLTQVDPSLNVVFQFFYLGF